MRLIEEGIRVNPSIITYLFDPDVKRFKKQLEALFSNYFGYYNVHELIEKLEEVRDGTERLFDRKNIQESSSHLKQIIDLCGLNYGDVDDSDDMFAKFIEESLLLYARIIQALNVEWSVKQKIHEDNWKMLVTNNYGLSDYLPSMIMNSCTTEDDFILIEKLASEELQKRKAKADEYGVSEIVDILLDLYEKKKNRKKFQDLCQKEFKYSYLRYIRNLEADGKIHEAAECCTKALEFATWFMKTELIEKLGDLKHAQRSDGESLSLYINAFKDRSEVELLGKIKHLSEELGSWEDVKDELTLSWSNKKIVTT